VRPHSKGQLSRPSNPTFRRHFEWTSNEALGFDTEVAITAGDGAVEPSAACKNVQSSDSRSCGDDIGFLVSSGQGLDPFNSLFQVCALGFVEVCLPLGCVVALLGSHFEILLVRHTDSQCAIAAVLHRVSRAVAEYLLASQLFLNRIKRFLEILWLGREKRPSTSGFGIPL